VTVRRLVAAVLGAAAVAAAAPSASHASLDHRKWADPCERFGNDAGTLLAPAPAANSVQRPVVGCSAKFSLFPWGYERATVRLPDRPYSWLGSAPGTHPYESAWGFWSGWGAWITWDGYGFFFPHPDGMDVTLHNWWPGLADKEVRVFLAGYPYPIHETSRLDLLTRPFGSHYWDLNDWTVASAATRAAADDPQPVPYLGGTGADELDGSSEADELVGRSGDDELHGGRGVDVLLGGRGQDDLAGGPGDDALLDRSGRDELRGGPGDDIFSARDSTPDRISCGSGRDVVVADPRDHVADDCELVYRTPDETPKEPPTFTR
jgi:hypothetical protein